jgi:phage tail-like protein
VTKVATRRYRFVTDSQWQTCLFAQIEPVPSSSGQGWRPFAPYAVPPASFASHGAHAPAADCFAALTWRDDGANLYRLAACDESPSARLAPGAVAHARRIVVNASGLWVPGRTSGTIECFDEDSLARRMVVKVADAAVVDLVDDGRQGVLVLTGEGCRWRCTRVDCAGHVVERVGLAALLRPAGFEFLRQSRQLVVLDYGHAGAWLRWFPTTGGTESATLFTPALGTCFELDAFGSDGQARLFLAGADHDAHGSWAHVVVLDGGGNPVTDIPLSVRATGVVGTRGGAVVTTARGLLRFSTAQVVPDGVPETRCTIITPMLRAPETPDGRRWLRIESLASLPPGTTLQIAWANADDPATRSQWSAIAGDQTMPGPRRVQALRDLPGVWNGFLAINGSAEQIANPDVPIAAPLFDVRAGSLWIALTLIAPSGCALPSLRELDVLYPGRTLMQSLPAIYQQAEAEPGSFVRALVGVLETTTQTLDASIAAMGSHIAPSTAPVEWLDYVARWLGVPWDDALALAQKQAILEQANAIAQRRGTRAGLEELLSCLVQGSPRRFRVVDATADVGFSTLAASSGCGSALPTLLAGLQRSAAELTSKAVVGCMRLPCPGYTDDGTRTLKGRIRVDIAASAGERSEWEPWMQALLAAMVPATARLELRWIHVGLLRSQALDGTVTLDELPATPQLGTDAVTGQVRLPAGPVSLSASGSDMGTGLH